MTVSMQGAQAPSHGLSSKSAAEVSAELERRYGTILQGPRPLDLPDLSRPTTAGEAAGVALLSECTSVLRAKHVEYLHSAHQTLLHVSPMPLMIERSMQNGRAAIKVCFAISRHTGSFTA